MYSRPCLAADLVPQFPALVGSKCSRHTRTRLNNPHIQIRGFHTLCGSLHVAMCCIYNNMSAEESERPRGVPP